MSHDPEAVEAIDQWLAMPQRPDRDTATDLLDYLAAAGYTVTKDRYESVSSDEAERFVAEAIHDYIADPEANWDDWLPEAHTAISGLLDRGVELYRKIEGSTDG